MCLCGWDICHVLYQFEKNGMVYYCKQPVPYMVMQLNHLQIGTYYRKMTEDQVHVRT